MSELKRVQVRFTSEQLAEIDVAARELRKSRAQIIREATRLSLSEYNSTLRFVEPEQGRALIELVRKTVTTLEEIRVEINRLGNNINQIAKQLNTSGALLSSEKAMLSRDIKDLATVMRGVIDAKSEIERISWLLLK